MTILEPVFNFNIDFYYRFRPKEPPSVFIKGNTEREKSFELKKIIDKINFSQGTRQISRPLEKI